MSIELVKVEVASFSFEDRKNVLKNISFSVNDGELLGISGESGCGKTTLAKIIAGIYKAETAKAIINPQLINLKSNRNPVQILFQNNGEILNPLRRISDIIDEALQITYKNNNNNEKKKKDILNSVGFSNELWNRKGFELSGGEQQRAALARLLSVNPKLLILDEPFSAQDVESQLNLISLFKKINSDFGITIICISHDLIALRNLVSKLIIMKNGEIVETGTTEDIFNKPQNSYTKFLLKAESYSLTLEEIKSSTN